MSEKITVYQRKAIKRNQEIERLGLTTAVEEIKRDPRLASKHTKRGYIADLIKFRRWQDTRPTSKLTIEAYAAHLQSEEESPNTINRALAAIRWWARKTSDLAYESDLSIEQRQEMILQANRIAGVENVRGERSMVGRHLGSGEIQALMQTCANDDSPAGARDAAILALARATGARRGELTGLTLEDVHLGENETGELIIRKAKGNKERKIPINDGAYHALFDWLAIRGSSPGPVFCRIDKGSTIFTDDHLSGEGLRLILAKRARQAKVENITLHDFRRTFAGDLLDAGADVSTVQSLMGHATATQTTSYDRRPAAAKRRAIAMLHVPYRRR